MSIVEESFALVASRLSSHNYKREQFYQSKLKSNSALKPHNASTKFPTQSYSKSLAVTTRNISKDLGSNERVKVGSAQPTGELLRLVNFLTDDHRQVFRLAFLQQPDPGFQGLVVLLQVGVGRRHFLLSLLNRIVPETIDLWATNSRSPSREKNNQTKLISFTTRTHSN